MDDDESMIKYFRDKIIGRPTAPASVSDLPVDDHEPSLKKANSCDGLHNDILINTAASDVTSQIEKFNAANSGISNFGRRSIISSSPIFIPKKPPRSSASSQSSSYTSIIDQPSSFVESSISTEDVSNSVFPILPTSCQQLKHSAARDRILVKNKQRQPIKQKLSTLRETDDNETDLFSSKTDAMPSTPEEEHPIVVAPRAEPIKVQPVIDQSDLDSARARLRVSVRLRDRSADNILLANNHNNTTTTSTTSNSQNANNNDRNTDENISPSPLSIISKFSNPIHRSVSFKRVQEVHDHHKLIYPPILKLRKDEFINKVVPTNKPIDGTSTLLDHKTEVNRSDEQVNNLSSSPTKSISSSSSQEHIYDNLDVFKQRSTKPVGNPQTNDDESSTTPVVKTRDHPILTTRLRPVTVHLTPLNEKQTANELETVFNQFKKRGSIRKDRPTDEKVQEPVALAPREETVALPSPSIHADNEHVVSTNKTIEPVPTPPTPNRRKTIVGVHLSANNKVATNDNKPTPSWIDIAKQKQNKFQSNSNDKQHQGESEQQLHNEPSVIVRKTAVSTDLRSNRKSMYEQTTAQANAHAIERDSIRALKAGNPNRINNLIQFFDK